MKLIAIIATLATISPFAQADTKTTPSESSAILLNEKLWETPIAKIQKDHPEFKFDWSSSAKNRLRSLGKGITTFGVPSGEIIVISSNDNNNVNGISISYFNKGDNGNISLDKFNTLAESIKSKITKATGSPPKDRSEKTTVQLTKTFWKTNGTAFQLEQSINSNSQKPEFLRLRVTSVRSARRGSSTARVSSLDDNVVKDDSNGDVYIKNIPMINQGEKSYCACASAARIYQYYGATTDQHEIAQLANTTADEGTEPTAMVKSLKRATGKLDSKLIVLYDYPDGIVDLPTYKELKSGDYPPSTERKFEKILKEGVHDANDYQKLAKKKKTKSLKGDYERFERDEIVLPREIRAGADPATYREMMMDKSEFDHFNRLVEKYIDRGIPIAWALELGMFKEHGIPQESGGHMRIILGYNKTKKQIIYSDSWGAGHEKKYMDTGNAFSMTDCILVMPPTK